MGSSFQIVYFIFIVLNLFARQANAAPPSSFFDSEVIETFEAENVPWLHPLWVRGPQYEEQKVEGTEDIIQLLQPKISDPFVGKLVEFLRTEEVRLIIDGVFKKYPQLPAVIKGLNEFFSGPEAKPLVDCLEESIPQLKSAAVALYQKIQGPFEEFLEVLVEEGIKIFFRLQNPQVMQVIQRLQELPEIQQLATYLSNYSIDLIKALKKLEAIIQGGL